MSRILLITLFFLFSATSSVMAQQQFEITNASQYFDIKIRVETCEEGNCRGKASFSFFKKGGTTPYQVITLPDTSISLDEQGNPNVNISLLYDQQSVINIGDFNFDGMEDVAICNGTNGSYGMPSYSVYLSNRVARKFVYDKRFSLLGAHLGMFEVDSDQKILRTFDKSGCCYHVTEQFTVVNNAPQKILEIIEDATIEDESKVKITTKRLVNGKWKTEVKYETRDEE